jgi:hypothetical protein
MRNNMKILILLSVLFLASCTSKLKDQSEFEVGSCYVTNEDMQKLGNDGYIYRIYVITKTSAYYIRSDRTGTKPYYVWAENQNLSWMEDDFTKVPCPTSTSLDKDATAIMDAVCADAKKLAVDYDKNVCDNEVRFNMDEE